MNVDTLDMDWLKSATLDDLTGAMRSGPQVLAAVNALLQTPEGKVIGQEMLNDPDYIPVSKRTPDPEEAAQIAEDEARAAEQARIDEEAAAADALVNPPAAPAPERKKIVVNYQATTEDGTPIGRPTHIEGWTWEEVSQKQQDAHVNAVRYAERVKKNRVQSVESTTQQTQRQAQVKQLEQDAQTAAAEAAKDPSKLVDAVKKATAADREAEVERQAAIARGRAIADSWIKDHVDDFVPCDANSKLMGQWMQTNNLTLSYENLELAYTATKHQLVKPVEDHAEAAPNTPPTAPAATAPATPSITAPVAPATVTEIPTETPVVQPASTVPTTTPAAAPNAQPAARRPGVNGGLLPGTLTAVRPRVNQGPVVSTYDEMMREIDAMPAKEYRNKVEKDAKFRARLEAAGIRVLGQRN